MPSFRNNKKDWRFDRQLFRRVQIKGYVLRQLAINVFESITQPAVFRSEEIERITFGETKVS